MGKYKWPKLSKLIGWNCIQRRNFAILEAIERGAKVIALIDDDNVPYNNWFTDIYINRKISAWKIKTNKKVFDPIGYTNKKELWNQSFEVNTNDNYFVQRIAIPEEVINKGLRKKIYVTLEQGKIKKKETLIFGVTRDGFSKSISSFNQAILAMRYILVDDEYKKPFIYNGKIWHNSLNNDLDNEKIYSNISNWFVLGALLLRSIAESAFVSIARPSPSCFFFNAFYFI